jgi:Uncharacterized conserved protein
MIKINTGKINYKKVFFQYFVIVLGLFAYTFGWCVFLIPKHIVGGGVAGVASIIYLALGVPIGVSNFLINSVLVVIGLRMLGLKFGLNTLFGIIVASFAFIFWQQIVHIQNYVDVSNLESFMCAILGAGIAGVGIGTTFNNGGNSGGTDIIALIVNKYHDISPGMVILYIDIFIVASSFIFVPGAKIDNIVYGYIVMIVFAYVLDLTIEGYKQAYQIMVFSSKNKEIADAIGSRVKRGVTLLNGYGWYSKKEQQVLVVIARKQDKVEIMKIIKEIDSNSFISIAKTQGVFGKNFDTIKS